MPNMEVFIDYPQENERVTSNVYAFRIGTAPQASKVEISIDDGSWMPCRQASGYWWHDWICFQQGDHHAVARAYLSDGSATSSKLRTFRRTNS